MPGSDPAPAELGSVEAGRTDHAVPVRTDGAISARSRSRSPAAADLRASDLRLLEALADQTAVAFRNTSLASQLAEHVAELDRTTRQLAESRARIIEADDAARRTLEAAIARDVLPHLVALPDELRRVREAVATGRRTGSSSWSPAPTRRSRRCAT